MPPHRPPEGADPVRVHLAGRPASTSATPNPDRSARGVRWRLAACLALVEVPLSAQVVTISDTEFAPSDWTMTLMLAAGNGGSGSASQMATKIADAVHHAHP